MVDGTDAWDDEMIAEDDNVVEEGAADGTDVRDELDVVDVKGEVADPELVVGGGRATCGVPGAVADCERLLLVFLNGGLRGPLAPALLPESASEFG